MQYWRAVAGASPGRLVVRGTALFTCAVRSFRVVDGGGGHGRRGRAARRERRRGILCRSPWPGVVPYSSPWGRDRIANGNETFPVWPGGCNIKVLISFVMPKYYKLHLCAYVFLHVPEMWVPKKTFVAAGKIYYLDACSCFLINDALPTTH